MKRSKRNDSPAVKLKSGRARRNWATVLADWWPAMTPATSCVTPCSKLLHHGQTDRQNQPIQATEPPRTTKKTTQPEHGVGQHALLAARLRRRRRRRRRRGGSLRRLRPLLLFVSNKKKTRIGRDPSWISGDVFIDSS